MTDEDLGGEEKAAETQEQNAQMQVGRYFDKPLRKKQMKMLGESDRFV